MWFRILAVVSIIGFCGVVNAQLDQCVPDCDKLFADFATNRASHAVGRYRVRPSSRQSQSSGFCTALCQILTSTMQGLAIFIPGGGGIGGLTNGASGDSIREMADCPSICDNPLLSGFLRLFPQGRSGTGRAHALNRLRGARAIPQGQQQSRQSGDSEDGGCVSLCNSIVDAISSGFGVSGSSDTEQSGSSSSVSGSGDISSSGSDGNSGSSIDGSDGSSDGSFEGSSGSSSGTGVSGDSSSGSVGGSSDGSDGSQDTSGISGSDGTNSGSSSGGTSGSETSESGSSSDSDESGAGIGGFIGESDGSGGSTDISGSSGGSSDDLSEGLTSGSGQSDGDSSYSTGGSTGTSGSSSDGSSGSSDSSGELTQYSGDSDTSSGDDDGGDLQCTCQSLRTGQIITRTIKSRMLNRANPPSVKSGHKKSISSKAHNARIAKKSSSKARKSSKA